MKLCRIMRIGIYNKIGINDTFDFSVTWSFI